MGLNKHLQVSVMAGLFDKYNGASNYVSDRPSPSHVTKTCVCRAKSREEHLDVNILVRQKITPLANAGEEKKKATHVVVGVFYGAEAYCVFTHDLDEKEESRQQVEENLSVLADKWNESLSESQDLFQFKQKFNQEEKQLLQLTKCRLYSDLQTEAVRECSVFDAYKQCLILIDQVQNSNMAVPIAVLLCPLEVFSNPSEEIKFHDVDVNQMARSFRVWEQLENIRIKADALRANVKAENRPRLRRFVDAIVKYQQLLKTAMKEDVLYAREHEADDEVVSLADIAENHIPFRPARLKRWLYYEQAEIEITDKVLADVRNITFAPNEEDLDPTLVADKKYSLVLVVPSLNEMEADNIRALEDYVEQYKELTELDACEDDDYDLDGETTEDEEEKDGIAFHTVQFKQKLLQSEIRALAEHIERNEGIENQVKFFVSHNRDSNAECYNLLYDYSHPLKKTYTFQMPQPPKNLRVRSEAADRTKRSKKSSVSIRVEWDYDEDKDYPYHFLVEYRPQGRADSWSRKKTKPGITSVSISMDPASTMDIRVATASFIGVSEFSEIIDSDVVMEHIETPKVRKQTQFENGAKGSGRKSSQSTAVQKKNAEPRPQPPSDLTLKFVTKTTAEIVWTPSSTCESFRFSYRVRYWQSGQDNSSSTQQIVPSSETSCRLLELQANTTYFVDVFVVSLDSVKNSCPSEILKFSTLDERIRFGRMLTILYKKIGNAGGGLDVFPVPLSKLTSSGTVERYVFGNPCVADKKKHKTILLVGATGSGKTSLVNGIVNVIFQVDWLSPYRFQLDNAGGQTDIIKVYDINHYEGFKFNCSLTVIDTPGFHDVQEVEKNQRITEMIRNLFEDNGGEQQVDAIGLVMKSSLPSPSATEKFIFESIVSIFGNDVKDNIHYLFTFADQHDPPLLKNFPGTGLPLPKVDNSGEIDHFKFDSSAFFCCNQLLPNADGNKTDDAGLQVIILSNYVYEIVAYILINCYSGSSKLHSTSIVSCGA